MRPECGVVFSESPDGFCGPCCSFVMFGGCRTLEIFTCEAIRSGIRFCLPCEFFSWFLVILMSYNSHKRTQSHDRRCTRCLRHTEKFDHIFNCNKSKLATTGAVSVLRDFLRKSKISLPMIRCMIHGIQQWLINGNELS